MTQFVSTNLYLLRDELASLARTPFFSKALESYLAQLIGVVGRAIDEFGSFPPEIADDISRQIWRATQYLKGGTSKSVPFEMVYALELALRDWTSHPCAITTALLDDLDYHFLGVDPTIAIRAHDPQVRFENELIQIALPRLYRHRPLYNVALYHELGHYIDTHFRVSELSLLQNPAYSRLSPERLRILLNHSKEYFADLFAVSYTGVAFVKFLETLAFGAPDSFSHPATSKRVEKMENLMLGRSDPLIDAFQSALSLLKLPALAVRYRRPDIDGAFNSIRTYSIADSCELHGVLEAAWVFLESAEKQDRKPWSNIPVLEIGQIVNDLVEKSIRNFMTVMKWQHGNNQRASA